MPVLQKKRYRVLTVNFQKQNEQPIPFIRLQGKWLGRFGFQRGDTIQVETRPGRLVIRRLTEKDIMETSQFSAIHLRGWWHCFTRLLYKKFASHDPILGILAKRKGKLNFIVYGMGRRILS